MVTSNYKDWQYKSQAIKTRDFPSVHSSSKTKMPMQMQITQSPKQKYINYERMIASSRQKKQNFTNFLAKLEKTKNLLEANHISY